MKRLSVALFLSLLTFSLSAGVIEKSFRFDHYTIRSMDSWQTIQFDHTVLSGITGEPLLPWQQIVLMLPPGEAAASVEFIESGETAIPGIFRIHPAQPARPLSDTVAGRFALNEQLYRRDMRYPDQPAGKLMTQYLNGHSFAICNYTPMRFNPATGKVTYFSVVTVRIRTEPDDAALAALQNLTRSPLSLARITEFAMNPELAGDYPVKDAPSVNYEYLIVCPPSFKTEFQPLINLYAGKGLTVRVVATDSIYATMTGYDQPEKIRNFIINQVQNHGIDYVLLAGNPSLVPYRGFYCYVNSGGSPYMDSNIPADLYYSALDGTFDANGNHVYAEVADNPDLLPDIAVGRFTVNDTASLHKMIRKTVSYLTNPVLGEFNRPMLAGEYLYNAPITFGKDYMELLCDDHNDNGYFTHGIPTATNQIDKLYDTLITASPLNYWQWSTSLLLSRINEGKPFIHHLGHANTTYMLRLNMSQVTNANFSQVNGITRNYQILYTQGCYDGAFDAGGGCIAAKAVSIDNWLVAGIFNSRYGWFNQGTTDGPSQHLQREFVSCLYHDTLPDRHIGTAHLISKIKTAPFVGLPGEFEPGAQRWVHYCCNLFGDPALEVWTSEPTSFTANTWTGSVSSDWTNPGNWSLGEVPTSLNNVIIGGASVTPVISTSGNVICHDLTIMPGGNLIINPGKSLMVYGTVTMTAE